ncbi:MAG TPA: DUF2071 domain-containing protein [Acidobacterium sp.]|uniref:DUF2071 domain-containing protein n=2 Tax=Acidobacteriaceae TaxID=204434 RepID=C1F675_ACIC5|nr:conserved hypothetical protein [Acidobacterium capsulatum ATCC 51196]HCT61128.1 DUF2071 domain-containing protein [Acidobacterium sp.]
MNEILSATSHRPWPLPNRPWTMLQRWNDLLFAHWPVPPEEINALLPSSLAVDTFDGSAWIGVVPFWMDRVRLRGLPSVPGANRFPELNLRTYVRDRSKNTPGVYFFSLDAASPLAVAVARLFFQLPYFWARMGIQEEKSGEDISGRGTGWFHYTSERRMSAQPVRFKARYRSLGKPAEKGLIEHFLTERYALFTPGHSGELYQGNIHHMPWPLEQAEAEIELNELPEAHGLRLPGTQPLLHYSRELVVYVWNLETVPALSKLRAGAAVPVPKPL